MILQNVSLVNMVLTITVTLFVCISLTQATDGAVMAVRLVPSTNDGTANGDGDLVEIMSQKNKSILYDDNPDRCYLCGKYKSDYVSIEEHHIFGGSCKRVSDRRGFVVHLCRECHHTRVHNSKDHSCMDYLHQKAQMIYEEHIGTREEFIKEFIRSYL